MNDLLSYLRHVLRVRCPCCDEEQCQYIHLSDLLKEQKMKCERFNHSIVLAKLFCTENRPGDDAGQDGMAAEVDLESVEFRRLLMNIGDKLSDLQAKGIAEVYAIPPRLYRNGAEMLMLLYGLRVIRPESLESLRADLDVNKAGEDVLELIAKYEKK